jgi:hypothetical protein
MKKNGVLAKIRTEYLQNTSSEHYSYANPLEVSIKILSVDSFPLKLHIKLVVTNIGLVEFLYFNLNCLI